MQSLIAASVVGAAGYVAHQITRSPATTELTGLDATWLLIDNDPNNRIIVNAVMTFDTVLTDEQIAKTLQERLLKHPRFRMRAVVGDSDEKYGFFVNTKWEPCEMDMKNHVFRLSLPGSVPKRALPKGYETPKAITDDRAYTTKPQKVFGRSNSDIESDHKLLDYISKASCLPLPLDMPLWQIHVLDNYGSGTALFFRIHHCKEKPPGDLSSGTEGKESSLGVAKIKARRHNSEGASSKIFSKILQLLQWPFLFVLAFMRLIFMRPDVPTQYNGKVGLAKTAVWSAQIPLESVKGLAKKLDATVNDVVIGIVTGALRKYLIKTGSTVKDLTIRSVVPFNLQPLDSRPELKNEFSLLYVPLPLHLDDPVVRIKNINGVMNSLKNGVVPAVHLLAMQIFSKCFPLGILRILFRYYSQMATIIMSNVPGPTVPLYFAGHKIKQVIAWVPQSGSVGLGVSIVSYAGNFRIGFFADAGLVTDPQFIVNAIESEFVELFDK